MSNTPLPEYVDQRKIFTQQGDVSGFIEFARLPRLSECLADQTGRVKVILEFVIDESGRKVIHGSLEAKARVICQRCLNPMEIQLRDEVSLVVLHDENAVKSLDRQFDPWLCSDHKIDLLNLVDEQLVLCMPIVNLHQDGPCAESRSYEVKAFDAGQDLSANTIPSKSNPFAVLDKLRKVRKVGQD